MAAGQKINLAKSAIAFNPNTPVQLRNEVSSILAIPIVEFHEKYLGLPTVIGRKKKDCFNGIKERLRKKLNGWKEKLLSKAGKALLIKAVAQSIPNYAMGVFKLPDEGGMGFRDLESFNKALVAMQCWRLLTNEHTMIHKVLKARYFPNCNFLEAGCELLLSGLRKRIGDGQETLVYGDAWIPRPNSFHPISPKVLNQETKEDVKAITSIPLSVNYHKDRWIWHYTTNGIYSVKSGYRLEMSKKKKCSEAIGSSSKPRIRSRSCAQEVIFNRAHSLADEYGSLVKGEPKLIVEKPTKWSPPPVGKYKLNVYAAFIPETGVGGIGDVVRNDKGEVMAAMALPLATATSPNHA
ncbi:unnamed protein product [Prunus armeniaca]